MCALHDTTPTIRELIAEAMRVAEDTQAIGEHPSIEMPDDWGVTEYGEALTRLIAMGRAMHAVRSECERVMAHLLDEGGAYRYGDTVFQYAPQSSEKVTDPEGMIEWLEDHPAILGKVVNPNYLRKGSLPKPVRDRFYLRTDEAAKLTTRPAEAPNTPKWMLGMEDGEQRRSPRSRRKPKDD